MDEFTIGQPSPKQQTVSRLRNYGQITIPIVNRSQTKTTFRLEGIDHQKACHFEFQPPDEDISLARQIELELAPGESATIPVRIIPPPRSIAGFSKTVYHFTITVTILSGSRTPRSVLGQLTVRPLIGSWLLSITMLCCVALVLYFGQAAITQPIPEPHLIGASEKTEPVKDDAKNEIIQPHLDNTEPLVNPDEDAPTPKAKMTYDEIFQDIAPRYGLDWRLLAEIAYQESRMNSLAIGKDHDLGLMQIIPSTWNEWAPKVGVSNPFDPYSNVLVAAAYLAYVRDYSRSKGYDDDYWMLLGYNWGPNNLRRVFEDKQYQIPEKRHQYALDILHARAIGTARWQTVAP